MKRSEVAAKVIVLQDAEKHAVHSGQMIIAAHYQLLWKALENTDQISDHMLAGINSYHLMVKQNIGPPTSETLRNMRKELRKEGFQWWPKVIQGDA